MTPELLVLAIIVAGTGTAAIIDVRVRRVPNALTASLAGTGVALAAGGLGSVSLAAAAAGGVVGVLLMLPGHVLGATGAGDVKLLASAGTLLGPASTLKAFLFMAIAGAVIALVVAGFRGRMRRTLEGTSRLVLSVGGDAGQVTDAGANNRFAYAPAIAVGAVLAAAAL